MSDLRKKTQGAPASWLAESGRKRKAEPTTTTTTTAANNVATAESTARPTKRPCQAAVLRPVARPGSSSSSIAATTTTTTKPATAAATALALAANTKKGGNETMRLLKRSVPAAKAPAWAASTKTRLDSQRAVRSEVERLEGDLARIQANAAAWDAAGRTFSVDELAAEPTAAERGWRATVEAHAAYRGSRGGLARELKEAASGELARLDRLAEQRRPKEKECEEARAAEAERRRQQQQREGQSEAGTLAYRQDFLLAGCREFSRRGGTFSAAELRPTLKRLKHEDMWGLALGYWALEPGTDDARGRQLATAATEELARLKRLAAKRAPYIRRRMREERDPERKEKWAFYLRDG